MPTERLPPPNEITEGHFQICGFWRVLGTAIEFSLRIRRQRCPIDKCIALLAKNSKQSRDAKVEVVVGLDFRRLLVEQNGCSAAERFEIDAMLRKEFDDAGSEVVLAAMPFDR